MSHYSFILIRFGLLLILNQDALKRAAHFAPIRGKERTAYWMYQVSNLGIFICMFFLNITFDRTLSFYIAVIFYIIGILTLLLSVIYFAHPSGTGLNQKGIYRLSRNPMYVAYFIYFLGCILLTRSFILLGFVIIFQVSAHWIILSEERWCIEKFGQQYVQYMQKVRRYL